VYGSTASGTVSCIAGSLAGIAGSFNNTGQVWFLNFGERISLQQVPDASEAHRDRFRATA